LRVKENIEKAGYFWLPFAPDRKIPGTLIIKDGGNIELEVVGLFDESLEGVNRTLKGQYELGRIVGHIETYGLVTLDDCFYKKTNISFGGISRSSVHAKKAFLGVAYDEKEEIVFNTFKFSVEGIDEWVGLTGIKVERQFENKTASITYSPPEEILINLKNGMKLLITFSWTLPGFPNAREAKITQKTYFKLVSEQECPLNDFISAAYKITTLIGFAIDKTVCIELVFVTSDAIRQNVGDGKTVPVSISLYYASLPYTEIEPKIDSYRMLFRFAQIQDDAERIVNNWFDAYDKIDPALNLYFSAKTGAQKYIDGKFLALVQGLESYHRRTSNEKIMDDNTFKNIVNSLIKQCPEEHREWLSGRLQYANEISLAQRIESIIEPFNEFFETSKTRKNIVRNIVDTRNYLTHYNEYLKSRAAVGRELWLLCLKMEAIFQLHLLQVLGFTREQIEAIFKNGNGLQNKIKEI